jgi:Na+-transporting methylmalonyl-CoA/oxaloacetate decarboxylase gamma subunit
VDRLRELLSGGELRIRVAEPLVSPAEAELIEADPTLQAVGAAIERAASILGVVLVVVTVLILLLYGLRRVRRRSLRLEEEIEQAEQATYGAGILERGVRTVRDLLDMVRRFGVSRELLAAVSVQNIYANLCRLGRYRGKERLPSQPPDNYLPTLISLFEGHEEALSRITSAYMRVHYGEQAVSLSELTQLRLDYYQIRRSRRAHAVD